VWPGPSPAALLGEATRALAFRAVSYAPGVDVVEEGVGAVGVAAADLGRDVAVAGHDLVDSELAQVGLVLLERWCDHSRPRVGGELDGDAADAAGGADHE